MPKRKPQSLNTGSKSSKESRAARAAVESALMPSTMLTIKPPAELQGRKVACAEWKRIMGLQLETQAAKEGAPIITAFDQRSLITYCKALDEERTLEAKLSKLDTAQDSLYARAVKMRPTPDNLKEYLSLWQQVNGLTANFKGMSARLDSHRAHSHELAKSLYLTPASRAGVAPPIAEPEEPESEMDQFLKGV